MKKKLLAVTCLALASTFSFAACNFGGGTTSSTDSASDSAGAGNKAYIAETKNIAGFNAAYKPMASIEKQQGVIDVALVFEDTIKGWEALAAEYSRLHGGAVTVNLIDEFSETSRYTDKLGQQVNTNEGVWDIVQGNLFQDGGLRTYCLDMYTAVNGENAYAGEADGEARIWKQVLMPDAYLTDKSGGNVTTYIMNSEGLQTAWFVNDVARDAAIAKGYTGSETPANWQELMDLCYYMQQAGYESPLGIALDQDSVNASQFTWLLRVYGDYYYRSEYQNIMLSEDFEYDRTDINPEANLEYGVSANKFFYSIFMRTDSNYYVGPESEKFQEFIEQLQKMKPYLRKDAADKDSSGLTALRSEFATQSKQEKSPQILLDYAGAGLNFLKNENESFKVDFFDYPVMESKFIHKDTALRDVGGNGGYLSIIKRSTKQDALSLDFMKFVVSPYGQSIYYEALNAAGSVPMGMTTVKNDTVVIPEAWKTFFATKKISFNGLVDSNPYISYLIRGFADEEAGATAALENWQKYLTGTNEDAMTTQEFIVSWTNALSESWKTYCSKNDKDVNLYKTREGNLPL